MPRSPAANQGCESCHGPGGRHVEDPSDPSTILRFDEAPSREASAACLSCHTRDNHALWEGSAHDVRNLFICDGSSLVTSTRGQPTETICALAFRAGEKIAEFAKRGEI